MLPTLITTVYATSVYFRILYRNSFEGFIVMNQQRALISISYFFSFLLKSKLLSGVSKIVFIESSLDCLKVLPKRQISNQQSSAEDIFGICAIIFSTKKRYLVYFCWFPLVDNWNCKAIEFKERVKQVQLTFQKSTWLVQNNFFVWWHDTTTFRWISLIEKLELKLRQQRCCSLANGTL